MLSLPEPVPEPCNCSHSQPAHGRGEALVKPEEAAILLVVFGIWFFACALFYARWESAYT